jgi:DNA-binding NarL/FixJ family response regulator
LTTFDDTELIHNGLRAGALGYSLKDITAEELAMTVRMAARGQVLLQPDIASKVFSALTLTSPIRAFAPPTDALSSDAAMPVGQLTEREHDILKLLAQGTSNRQIAEKLYLTEGTVKNHMSNILSKLGVRDRTQAALKAKELGLA